MDLKYKLESLLKAYPGIYREKWWSIYLINELYYLNKSNAKVVYSAYDGSKIKDYGILVRDEHFWNCW